MITYDQVTFDQGMLPIATVDVPGDVASTTGLFQATADFAREYGGQFVRDVLEQVEGLDPEYPLIVDSKIHMLKPGWLPCIPGWHVDFAPGWLDVVDWSAVDPKEQHWMAISSGVSATEYVVGFAGSSRALSLSIPRAPRVNGFLSKAVELYKPGLEIHEVEPGVVYQFSQLTLHRGVPAVVAGWRQFVRVSATRLRLPLDGRRLQASQVYILARDEHAGW